MVTLLRNTDSDFTARFEDFITARRDDDQDVSDVVRAILTDVRTRGDVAVFEYTNRFDKLDLTPETIRVSPEELANPAAPRMYFRP